MTAAPIETPAAPLLARDGWLLFTTRGIRLFAYGAVSVILVLYLAEAGLSDAQIGLLLTLTLLGDTAVSLWLTTRADRWGRRRTLVAGALLMLFSGLVFAFTRNFLALLTAATLGVISPSGNEVGPFLSVEQAGLSQIVSDRRRTAVFAWYSLIGSLTTALGALAGGLTTQLLEKHGSQQLAYRTVIVAYACLGLLLALLFMQLTSKVEVVRQLSAAQRPRWGVGRRSRPVVLRLCGLFALDAFGGGFVIQSLVAYWFHLRFGADPALLGAIFFGANLLAGVSALLAARLATRFGLVNTMVFTHLPSNVLLILVPLMPNLTLAIIVLLLRFSISQMDVPTRQSYTMAVVRPEERSAAAGMTGVARTTGAAIAPLLAGPMLASSLCMNLPFIVAGGLKIVYDLLLYRSFTRVKPPEESS